MAIYDPRADIENSDIRKTANCVFGDMFVVKQMQSNTVIYET